MTYGGTKREKVLIDTLDFIFRNLLKDTNQASSILDIKMRLIMILSILWFPSYHGYCSAVKKTYKKTHLCKKMKIKK